VRFVRATAFVVIVLVLLAVVVQAVLSGLG
jgi:hypothetical protein